MTDSVHPTIDELADFHADVLSGAAADRIREHLATCSSCADELARIDEVSNLLGDTSTDELTMPAEVVTRIDRALSVAGAERSGEVASLSTARERKRERSGRRTPWVLIGGAAAAAVVVIGSIGLNGMQGTDDDDSAGGAADSAAESAPQLESGSQDDAGADKAEEVPKEALAYAEQELTSKSLPSFARSLAGEELRSGMFRLSKSCSSALSPEQAELPRAQVLWSGRPAVVVVDGEARTASVFGCGTDSQLLYSTSY